MTTRVPMTKIGAERLREELDRLKRVDRPGIIKAIAEAREHLKKEERPKVVEAIEEARAHGDLSENAEYDAAKERQSFVEGRIREIESKLSHAQIIDISTMPAGDKVIFGATVTLVNVDTDEEVRYQIVGDDEAEVKAGKISVTSPLARAMIGKEVGDPVSVKTPAGLTEYEIEKVEYI